MSGYTLAELNESGILDRIEDGLRRFIDEAPARQEVRQLRRKKERIPTDLRWEAWERDDFTCRHCGTRRHLSVDHIIPESKGGQLTLDNVQTLCRSCNSKKGTKVE